MEDVCDNKPNNWNFINPSGICSTEAFGNVHSGNYAVNIADCSIIEQTIPVEDGGCFYRFSFFANGEGSEVGLKATVTFITACDSCEGGVITIRKKDLTNYNRDFSYFEIITSKSPSDTCAVNVKFEVEATGNQSLNLDDVSLSVY